MQSLLPLIFLLLPTYLIRFQLGPVPTTLLEVFILISIGTSLYYNGPNNVWREVKQTLHTNKLLFAGLVLFFLGATLSLFTATNVRAAAGEWKAFYLEPILFFFVLAPALKKNLQQRNLLLALILSGLITAIFAVYQHFTGWLVPDAFWANGTSYRVTAWYGFPNGVGLFLSPLIPLALYLIHSVWYEKKKSNTSHSRENRNPDLLFLALSIVFLFFSIPAIFFAKSTGALVGVAGGIGLLLLLYKKTRWPSVALIAIGVIILFSLPPGNAVRTELLAQDRSGQIRRAIWNETVSLLKDRPLLGAGLASYDDRIVPYHTTVNGEGIEIFHHPHNIFLSIYVNTGLMGLTGFILILIWFYSRSSRLIVHSSPNRVLPIYLMASMTVILVSGLVDSPYIKNDLAILFWLLPALLIATIDSKERIFYSKNPTY